ncbi:hypothetical protein IscW_ISCW005499 [Ixodes scapularis]|uniref:Uncharacterized protein n=1 Tax=Ixodes scapularis TaxID=6945 RepID=B7PMQ9_IXOSC|nr:hypothetical protein IscW_ISCW005499 [Ixodes scapularis]|eukprot:XP_002435057.1 hypothetical protein IscW_ISCW005499 [Ixodes scapularis]
MDPAVALELQVQQESTSRSRICTVIAVMACIVMGCFLLLGFSLKRNDELVAILDQYLIGGSVYRISSHAYLSQHC